MKIFSSDQLKGLYKPESNSSNEQNGQVTIIGGSKLFHGAPILSLKVASRIVDMVFFATPEKSVGYVAEQIKSKLMSFIWVPWEEVDKYIEKSNAALIGPGFMSFRSESDKRIVESTKNITKKLLTKFPNKKWVIDAGSLQVMEADWIPKGAIITPNKKEFEMLFVENVVGEIPQKVRSDSGEILRLRSEKQNSAQDDKTSLKSLLVLSNVKATAQKYSCTIVLKGPETYVCSSGKCTVVKGGNAGLTKGGTGDVLAGLTVALFAKNSAHLSACAASYIEKKAAGELYKKVGTNYNAEDLADEIPETLASFSR